MDDQVFTLINEKIDSVDKKVDAIAKDVAEMLAFKWQIIGGSLVASVLIGAAMQIFIAYISK